MPWTDAGGALTVKREADNFWRAEARLGFMERPDIPAILAECKMKGGGIDLDDVTYYVGARNDRARARTARACRAGRRLLFAAMGRNAAHLSDYLELPRDQVVEIGREIEL